MMDISYCMGIEVVRDKARRILEIHRQKHIRKILSRFVEYVPLKNWDSEVFSLRHYTPTAYQKKVKTLFHADGPINKEGKKLVEELPYNYVIFFVPEHVYPT